MTVLECKNLTKEYLSGESVIKAVDNLSLEFEKGEFCAVTGPSGSGKSTLLHILSSLENLKCPNLCGQHKKHPYGVNI